MAYIHRTPAGAGSSTVFTLSYWVKRAKLGTLQTLFSAGTANKGQLVFDAEDQLKVVDDGAVVAETSRVFRDVGAWYHIVLAYDTGASGTDKVKIYVNGVQETAYATDNRSTAGSLNYVNAAEPQNIGADTSNPFYGEMSHVQMVDGAQLAPTEFGEVDATSGMWKLKTATYGTAGTNGFHLKMEDSSNLDLDSSSNGHTFTTTGTLTATKDNPDNNFCTWNPTNKSHNQTYTFENGNTVALIPSASGWAGTSGTLAASAGKWYMEGKVNYTPGAVNTTCGFASDRAIACKTAYGQLGYVDKGALADYAPTFGVYDNGALLYATTSANNQSTGSWATAWVSGDIVMFAVDIDAGKFYHGKNGTWDTGASNNPAAGTGGYTFTPDGFLYTPITTIYQGRLEMNFGNGYFGTTVISSAGTSSSGDDAIWEHDCPTGFYGLNTKNIKLYG